MAMREIVKMIQGERAIDGAGVHMVRVLSGGDAYDFDPFLMLDSFDSTNPADYTAGFPTHPHRGIETITYLISGKIEHEDSLGNKGAIHAGESQWMTAGSGILHQEMPKVSDRMLGFQLWLNLPQKEKMVHPAYLDITRDMIATTMEGNAEVRVMSGSFGSAKGSIAPHIPAEIYDVQLPKAESIRIPTQEEHTAFVFFIEGSGVINGQAIAEKTAVLFGKGDEISISAAQGKDARFIFFSAKPLHEPIAWGGPIVMNTQEELRHAFAELQDGTFIKHD